ncbi:MAG: phosphoribosylglycinamide formyltransferase [Ignavibacteriaceae bacterium]|nr:phosphoribosylglycinamide formyltransferase [Ignavibacteriaceae bacterium]
MKIAVFASGKGSGLVSLYEKSFIYGSYSVECVVSDKEVCGALEFAARKNIPVINSFLRYRTDSVFQDQVISLFTEYEINLIVLAGYLKLFPDFLLKRFSQKVINIHPALLPLFGGKGFYGEYVHSAVFKTGMKVSGATVHFVNEKYDEGNIIAQETCDVSDAISPDEIAAKVLKTEHTLLPKVVHAFATNKISSFNGRVTALL